MSKIIISKNGFKYQEWNEESEWDETIVINKCPDMWELHNLNCVIESGTTLRDIFNVLKWDSERWAALFGPEFPEMIIDSLEREFKVKWTDNDIDGMKYIEVHWDLWIEDDETLNLKTKEVELCFDGVSCQGKGDKHNYSFSASDPAKLLYYEVKINPSINLTAHKYAFSDDCCDKAKTEIFDYTFLKSKMYPSLFHVIHALSKELRLYSTETRPGLCDIHFPERKEELLKDGWILHEENQKK